MKAFWLFFGSLFGSAERQRPGTFVGRKRTRDAAIYAELETQVLPSSSIAYGQAVYVASVQSVSLAITAHSGGGQANAVPITTKVAYVTTVAADHDSVVLPAAVVGLSITILNEGAHILDVYGNGTDTINAIAASSPLSLASPKTCILTCPVAGKWYSIPLAP
jgi:hypothetical protein